MLYRVEYLNNGKNKPNFDEQSVELDVDELTLTTKPMSHRQCRAKARELESNGFTVLSIGACNVK